MLGTGNVKMNRTSLLMVTFSGRQLRQMNGEMVLHKVGLDVNPSLLSISHVSLTFLNSFY